MTYTLNGVNGYDLIDNATTLGLLAADDSLSHRVGRIQRRLSHCERWFGVAATPSGETHVADAIGPGVVAFTIDAGNNNWGSWVQVVGSSDTPRSTGNTHFTVHEIQCTANERNTDYFFQLAGGDSGAAGLAADYYGEKVLTFGGVNEEKFFFIETLTCPVGTKVWARCMCPGQNTATMSFFIGTHEYEG